MHLPDNKHGQREAHFGTMEVTKRPPKMGIHQKPRSPRCMVDIGGEAGAQIV